MNGDLKLELGKRELIVETNTFAEQSNGSAFVRYGDTSVLATAVMSRYEKEAISFFPLTVNYEERFYAAGKIMGSRYIKRESRPSDEAILNARLIDRIIRPLFPKNIGREIQVVTTVLSWDRDNEPDTIGVIASSLALAISDIPWQGPVAAVRVGMVDNEFILNPTYEQTEKSSMDIVFAGMEKDGEVLINMIEGKFDQVPEDHVVKSFEFAKPYIEKLINFQNQIAKKLGKEKFIPIQKDQREFERDVKNFVKDKLKDAIYHQEKGKKSDKMGQLRDELSAFVKENYPDQALYAEKILEKEVDKLIHEMVLKEDKRSDGRKLDEVRGLDCKLAVLPRTHGSALFSRGQTKSLSILTLGAPGDVQLIEGMEIKGKKHFMHHYNFPPYSVGETRPIRGPGRREIGHGMLAEKALSAIMPSPDEFPYTVRIVSEIVSSNGSSSMAAICSSCLALMDAGVPIKTQVAGIALGLMADGKNKYKLLTDIQGPEDHYGDMDFKVAGSRNGITAIQLDVKIYGITLKILKDALLAGKKARLKVLDKMTQTIERPRDKLSPFAPRILTLNINPEKIGLVIGPGGKTINEIIEETGASIDIEDSGKIFITADKEDSAKKALSKIEILTHDIAVGETFHGKVVKILDFGAFVELLPGQDGLIHISKLDPGKRVRNVRDVLKEGDIVPVKVMSIDKQGKIDLALTKLTKKTYGGR
jgi:polyribonucleotide nucleotidyltransferase